MELLKGGAMVPGLDTRGLVIRAQMRDALITRGIVPITLDCEGCLSAQPARWFIDHNIQLVDAGRGHALTCSLQGRHDLERWVVGPATDKQVHSLLELLLGLSIPHMPEAPVAAWLNHLLYRANSLALPGMRDLGFPRQFRLKVQRTHGLIPTDALRHAQLKLKWEPAIGQFTFQLDAFLNYCVIQELDPRAALMDPAAVIFGWAFAETMGNRTIGLFDDQQTLTSMRRKMPHGHWFAGVDSIHHPPIQ